MPNHFDASIKMVNVAKQSKAGPVREEQQDEASL